MASDTNLTIVLTGPESTGKTTLASQLAKHFAAPLVSEIARTMMMPGVDYTAELILEIAKAQYHQEWSLRKQTDGLLIADTDLTVTYVWSEFKFGYVDPWIKTHLAKQSQRRYLLMKPDLPWVDDPLRESPDDLQRLYVQYKKLLDEKQLVYNTVSGASHERLRRAIRCLNG